MHLNARFNSSGLCRSLEYDPVQPVVIRNVARLLLRNAEGTQSNLAEVDSWLQRLALTFLSKDYITLILWSLFPVLGRAEELEKNNVIVAELKSELLFAKGSI